MFVFVSETSFAFRISESNKKAILLIENPKKNTYGTGFIVKKGEWSFLVTNKHLIEGTDTAYVKFAEETKAKEVRISGKGIPLFLKKDNKITWKSHSDEDIDIAVIPMLRENLGRPADIAAIRYAILLTDSMIDSIGVNEGDEILLIGFPFTQPRDLPFYHIARKGLLALLTRDKIYIKIDGKILHENIYLIDASVFPGDSGGPVFVWHDKKPYLLGINFGNQFRIETDTLNLLDTLKVSVKQKHYIDLGLVLPADRIREVIDSFKSEEWGK